MIVVANQDKILFAPKMLKIESTKDVGNSMKTTGVDTDNWYLDLMDGHLKINRLMENGWKLEENNESDLNQKDTEESGS